VAQANLCLPGQYYVIDKKSAVPLVSCATCSPPAAGRYHVRNTSTSLTVSTLSVADSCLSAACPVSSVAGMYTAGCSGTSPGYLAPCDTGTGVGGLPFSDAVGYGYYTASCTVAPCTACTQSANVFYQNLLCPAAAGNGGMCTPCPAVANGFNVLITVTQKCEIVCDAGYFLNASSSCVPCTTQCAAPGYYKPFCNSPTMLPTPRPILDPTSLAVIGVTWYNQTTTADPPCLPCPVVPNSTPAAGSSCKWSCNTG
jgi:hypothetical protein